MSLFSKAAQGLNLTPAERAFLKLLKLWFYTALSTGVMAGTQYALNNQQINWVALIYIAGGAFLLSLLGALDKYWTAHGDLPLLLLTEAAIERVQPYVAPTAPAQPAQPATVPIMTNRDIQQVPFPSPVITTPQISFGDTGIVPTLPKP